MEVNLKKADNSDIKMLITLEKSVAGTKIYAPMLAEDEWLVALEMGAVYLIEKNSVVVGNISYEKKDESHAHISGLMVAPHFQGHGIAREALVKVLKELKDKRRIDLVVHPDNARALKLYQSLGFVEESKKDNYYGDGEPRLILVLHRELRNG